MKIGDILNDYMKNVEADPDYIDFKILDSTNDDPQKITVESAYY